MKRAFETSDPFLVPVLGTVALWLMFWLLGVDVIALVRGWLL